jgi:hypothetical protein
LIGNSPNQLVSQLDRFRLAHLFLHFHSDRFINGANTDFTKKLIENLKKFH